ncbi:MAG: glycosyltransferase family 4 protein [Azospirillaceae bacterium]|nr:glycosyltransferase family 4 protein [Azospirillaceae bacterium]
MTTQPLVIQWTPSSFFGWGVYGINLALTWTRDQVGSVLFSADLNPDTVVVNPLARRLLEPVFARSREFHETIQPFAGKSMTMAIPVLQALGNLLLPAGLSIAKTMITGRPNVGLVFFEDPTLDAAVRNRARGFDLIVAGSQWNRDLLNAAGITHSAFIMQGVDPTLFHPAPRAGYLPGRFLVFCGGKLEVRKGQDLALQAFRVFRARHPEALLVTAWHSPWPRLASGFDANPALAPFPYDKAGRPDVIAWAMANGLPPDSVIDLGAVPNAEIPQILREMDVALCPSRCEGGTNLVAMEAMACGVPTILSANTGHFDLIASSGCYPLIQQGPIPPVIATACHGTATTGWGESDIDEMVNALEAVFTNPDDAAIVAARGANFMARHDWMTQNRALFRLLAPLL